MEKEKATAAPEATIAIKPPKFGFINILIRGNAPLVIHKFSSKIADKIKAKHEAGSTARGKGGLREARDFRREFEDAKHVAVAGWCGIHAAAFRAAMISACRMVGFQMTKAKLSVFVEADGFDGVGTPLVRITKGEPHAVEHTMRLESGVTSLAVRPMWDAGWEAVVRVKWDMDQFTDADVVNLMSRVGA